MPKLFSEILNNLKNLNTRKKWYLFLLLISSIYVYQYRHEIYEFENLNATIVIFILWLILLMLPLFSEVDFLGIKFKKEIEKVSSEIKDFENNLQTQIMQLQISNSNSANINLEYAPLPTEKKIDELLDITRSLTNNQIQYKNYMSDIEKYKNDPIVFLFKVRFNIENRLRTIYNKYINSDGDFRSARQMANILHGKELIDGVCYDLIIQVLNISNRAVHGQSIDDVYIKLVEETYPEIISSLSSVRR